MKASDAAAVETNHSMTGTSAAPVWEFSPRPGSPRDKPPASDRAGQPHKRPYKRGKEWQRSSWKQWT